MRIWNALKEILEIYRIRRQLERWHEQPEWTDQDAFQLKHFLASTTGRKFSSYVRNGIAYEAVTATQNVSSLKWRCGYASGFRGLALLIEQLAQKQPAPPKASDSAGRRENLNP